MKNCFKVCEIGMYSQDGDLICILGDKHEAANKIGVCLSTLNKYINENKLHNGVYYKKTGNEISKPFYCRKNNMNIKPYDENSKIDERYWEKRICPICNTFFFARKKYKKITCSEKCYKTYININKNEINNKRRNKLISIYKNKPQNVIQEEQNKRKMTCLKKYGVDNHGKCEEYRKKMSQIMSQKDWTSRSEKCRHKMYDKYKIICENDNLELLNFNNRFDCEVKCKKCGSIFKCYVLGYLTEKTNKNLCRNCHPITPSISNTKPMLFIENILKKNNVDYKKNVRNIIYPYEIDLLIPSLKLGIEVNGNYWHSEESGGRDKMYHKNKSILCHQKGIKLIHILEDEIYHSPNLVENIIIKNIGLTKNIINSEEYMVFEINENEKNEFLRNNSLNFMHKTNYNICLKKDDEILYLITLNKYKKNNTHYYQIIDYVENCKYNVDFGFKKCLDYFMNKYSPNIIRLKHDIRLNGIELKKHFILDERFYFEKTISPTFFYVNKKDYLKRYEIYHINKKNMLNETIKIEYDKIWDCGKYLFVYNKNNGEC